MDRLTGSSPQLWSKSRGTPISTVISQRVGTPSTVEVLHHTGKGWAPNTVDGRRVFMQITKVPELIIIR